MQISNIILREGFIFMLNMEDFKKDFSNATGAFKSQSETIVEVINLVRDVAVPLVALIAVGIKVASKLKK